jgi:hypothetical protein
MDSHAEIALSMSFSPLPLPLPLPLLLLAPLVMIVDVDVAAIVVVVVCFEWIVGTDFAARRRWTVVWWFVRREVERRARRCRKRITV